MTSKSSKQASDLTVRYLHSELQDVDCSKHTLTPLDWHFATTCLKDILVTTGVPAVVPATYAIISARADILCNIPYLEMYFRFKDPRTVAETLSDVYQVSSWKFMLAHYMPSMSKDSLYTAFGYVDSGGLPSDHKFVSAHESCTTFVEYISKFCGFHANISLETDSVWLKRVHQRMAHVRVNTASKKTILENIDYVCSPAQAWTTGDLSAKTAKS